MSEFKSSILIPNIISTPNLKPLKKRGIGVAIKYICQDQIGARSIKN